jgi:predicted enzyme related to lactoylglutathione lyase
MLADAARLFIGLPGGVLANVVATDDGMVLVDWAGAGRGPRAWSLAFLLYAEGASELRRVDVVLGGYRRHVTLSPAELGRLAGLILVRPAGAHRLVGVHRADNAVRGYGGPPRVEDPSRSHRSPRPRGSRPVNRRSWQDGGMERVIGIGGYFMRAANPAALSAWYRNCLGLDTDENGLWLQEAGPTVFAAFESGTEYFGPRTQQTMLNFRVRDLDAMLAQLREKGADVTEEAQDMEGVGRFGWVTDPEGNRIELWQPA